ncbi:hypothetical protein [Francisella sp. TX07-6608]|uniref:hypothetical protein n=1 Tax=Francisella sp. TX07-6608 TaxID=573568 RepID=UPI0008F9B813|nr:hypothetical protein [Francisella sp. TX07-6608]
MLSAPAYSSIFNNKYENIAYNVDKIPANTDEKSISDLLQVREGICMGLSTVFGIASLNNTMPVFQEFIKDFSNKKTNVQDLNKLQNKVILNNIILFHNHFTSIIENNKLPVFKLHNLFSQSHLFSYDDTFSHFIKKISETLRSEYLKDSHLKVFISLTTPTTEHANKDCETGHAISLIFDFKNNRITLFDPNYLSRFEAPMVNIRTSINKMKSKVMSNIVGVNNKVDDYWISFDMNDNNVYSEIMHKIYHAFKFNFKPINRGDVLPIGMHIIGNKQNNHLNKLLVNEGLLFAEKTNEVQKAADIINEQKKNQNQSYILFFEEFFNSLSIESKNIFLKFIQQNNINIFNDHIFETSKILGYSISDLESLLKNDIFQQIIAQNNNLVADHIINIMFSDCDDMFGCKTILRNKISLLINYFKDKIDLDAQYDDLYSLSEYVCKFSDEENLKIWLETFKDKIDPNLKDKNGDSLTEYICKFSDTEKLKVWLETFKDKIDPNLKDKNGDYLTEFQV